MSLKRTQRRLNDPEVQQKAANFAAGLPGSGGYGVPLPGSKAAQGQRPTVSPFILPKSAGLNVISQTFLNQYYVEWDLSTWRAACDQASKMAFPTSYALLTSWAFESSTFIQSLFNALGSAIESIQFFAVDEKGNQIEQWTKEICKKTWFITLCKEILFSYFWGFSGFNFDPVNEKIYKYPMQDIDPINRMLRKSTFSFFEGINFIDHDNLLFVQPSTNYESFLGWMQPITRAFIQMNLNKMQWIGAGRRLAFPLMMVGYPQGDKALDVNGIEYNPFKLQAEEILRTADPTNGLVFPYTLDPKGNIIKSLQVEYSNPGGGRSIHLIYSEFNETEKNEIREMIMGGELTSSAGKYGTKGLGEVHERKLETVIEGKIEYILSILNDPTDFLKKLPKFYKNWPSEMRFDINRAKELDIDEVVKISTVVTQNKYRLTPTFFESNGLNPDFIEDMPNPTSIHENDLDQEVEMAQPKRGLFGLKKK